MNTYFIQDQERLIEGTRNASGLSINQDLAYVLIHSVQTNIKHL